MVASLATPDNSAKTDINEKACSTGIVQQLNETIGHPLFSGFSHVLLNPFRHG
jgi:hypothetical protein